MLHDPSFSTTVRADPRPASAVSHGVGLAGLAGLILWVAMARHFGMDGPYAALVNVAACAVPMILWSLLVDKVHRHPSTGIDWASRRPLRETIDVSLVKLTGLWVTWAAIALIYATGRFYWQGNFQFAMWCFEHAAPVRAAVAARLAWLGIELDKAANARAAAVITLPASPVEIRIIPADEEQMIARHTLETIRPL